MMTSVDTCAGVAPRRWPPLAGALAAATCLAGCGGASGTDEPSAASTPSSHWSAPLSQREAVRLANQATFGASEALLAGMRAQGARHWVDFQLTLGTSRYTRGEGDAIHRHPGPDAYCDSRGPACRRDAESTAPLLADFYANALEQPDQLRQRVAFALQQIVVLSGRELRGTYGFRHFYNGLLDRAFGNYREVLKLAALSPLMGDYLTFVNNGPEAPNENFGRELIQLFSLGTCLLEPDGSLRTGHCLPTYTNEMVRSVAHALTGWTYPAGGARHPGCAPAGLNCTYYQGEMVQAPGFHDTREHALPGGRSIPAGATGEEALEAVIDSLMAHPNMGPFIGRRLIQHLVTSNPTPAYVRRVAQAFESGRHEAVGTGVRGDLAATVHALLLDPEARAEPDPARAGKLREPALMFTGVLRGLDGRSDGAGLGPERGEALRQHVFRPTSVFGYYRPGYPVPGTTLEGPEFGIHGEGAAVERLDFLSALLGDDPTASAATAVDLTGFPWRWSIASPAWPSVPHSPRDRENASSPPSRRTSRPTPHPRGDGPASRPRPISSMPRPSTRFILEATHHDPIPVPARRRRFLAGLAGLGAVGSLAPLSLFGPRPAAAADYKALVCIHLFGGNDGHHMIVPTDPGGYERYATVRGRIALPRASVLPLGGIDFGLHPAMASLEGLWRSGQLAPVFNVGPLPRPLTKPEYLEAVRHDELPERLFSHADQIVLWDTASLDSTTRAGWGGRACEALATPHPVISVAGTTRYGSGSQRAPIVLPPTGTRFVAPGIDPTASSAAERARRAALDTLLAEPDPSPLTAAYAATQRRALALSARLAPLVRTQPGDPGAIEAIDQAFGPLIEQGRVRTGLGTQLYQVAKLIAGHATLGGDRQLFFASQGGYDTHRSQAVAGDPLAGRQAPLLAELADALAAFHAAMDGLGLARAVTSFTQTEFGRTFAPNRNDGTDHGWGNTQWVAGGSVQGGVSYGRHAELVLGGDSDASCGGEEALGRWIPTSAVDQYAATLLAWLGATDPQLDAVLPNLHRFGSARSLGFV